MPLLWGALETGWKTCVWGADGRAAEGGGCSGDKDMEVWWKGETSFRCLLKIRSHPKEQTLSCSFRTTEVLKEGGKKKKTSFWKCIKLPLIKTFICTLHITECEGNYLNIRIADCSAFKGYMRGHTGWHMLHQDNEAACHKPVNHYWTCSCLVKKP